MMFIYYVGVTRVTKVTKVTKVSNNAYEHKTKETILKFVLLSIKTAL